MTFERASLGLFAAALLGVFGALGGAFVRAIDTGATPTGAVHAIESPRASVGAQAGAASVVSDLAHLAEDALVIASNRGPVNFAEGASGAIEVRRAGGGLATGLAPLVENRSNVTWIASAVDGVDLRAARTRVPTPGFNMRYVTMDPARYDLAYNHVANEALWFAAHGFWDGVRAPRFDATFRDAWKAFRELNRKFAGAIDRAAPEGGTVLVQDYHLPLVGDLLRERRPDLRTVHFTHTPFGGPDEMRRLPAAVSEELLHGMAGFDAAGFHTKRWATRYEQSSNELIGRAAATYVAPLGIDPDNVRRIATSAEADRWVQDLRAIVGDRMVISRTDRIELSKNIVSGFNAYDDMLERHPELRNRVSFVASIFPSREAVEEYGKYSKQIEATVDRINQKYGTADWQPIVLFNDASNMPRAMAGLRIADAVLINPVRDGLNLVAKEGAVVNENHAALVLSRETGFFDELAAAGKGDAVLGINPFDETETSDALYRALTMPKRTRTRMAKQLRGAVEARGPEHWLRDQLHAAR